MKILVLDVDWRVSKYTGDTGVGTDTLSIRNQIWPLRITFVYQNVGWTPLEGAKPFQGAVAREINLHFNNSFVKITVWN